MPKALRNSKRLFTLHSFLNKDEVEDVYSRLMGLRRKWTPRTQQAGLYTLGTSTYLDAATKGLPAYLRLARKRNQLLKKELPDLYSKLTRKLEEVLGRPVEQKRGASLPGFHLFDFDRRKDLASFTYNLHSDWNFKELKWRGEKPDPEKTITFTVALALPKRGSGLEFWDLSDKKLRIFHQLGDDALLLDTWRSDKRYLPYQLGELVVHHSLFVHRVAPFPKLSRGDQRFTLQGHGLFHRGKWRIFW